MTDEFARFYPLIPGSALPGDWYAGRIPENIQVGENTVIDSSFCFKHFYATGPVGLEVGHSVTFWRTAISVEQNGIIQIGNECYIANASLVCQDRITIGAGVYIAGGVTIVDSDFHPIMPAARRQDAKALSPIGDRGSRPSVPAAPVEIADDVWIGYNATILKGVRVGAGAVIEPGAVVTRDVPIGARVAGNPARPVEAAL